MCLRVIVCLLCDVVSLCLNVASTSMCVYSCALLVPVQIPVLLYVGVCQSFGRVSAWLCDYVCGSMSLCVFV